MLETIKHIHYRNMMRTGEPVVLRELRASEQQGLRARSARASVLRTGAAMLMALCAAAGALVSAQGTGPQFAWAKRAGGSQFDGGRAVAVDGSGSLYVIGQFQGTAVFGSTTLTATSGATWDNYIAKLDNAGNFLWAVRAGGTQTGGDFSIAVDTEGNAYITGNYSQTVTFGSFTLTGAAPFDTYTFIAKLDGEGNFLWARSAGSAGSACGGTGISVDADGNVYVAGSFGSACVFGNTTLTGNGAAFITKLDGSGNFLWAHAITGNDVVDAAGGFTDPQGNTYVAGRIYGPVTIAGTTLAPHGNSGDSDVYVAKLDAGGNFLWAVSAGGIGSDAATGIALDDEGKPCVTGRFSGTASFGSTTLTSHGEDDIFVTKLDVAGNFLWATRAGGNGPSGNEITYGIAAGANGACCITGRYWNAADFGNTSLAGSNVNKAFMAKLDGSGNFLWAVAAPSASGVNGQGVAMDAEGDVYATGSFYGTATFGPYTLSSTGSGDAFYAKITDGGMTTGLGRVSHALGAVLYPNPSHDRMTFTLAEEASGEWSVSDLAGKAVLHAPFTGVANTIDVSGLAPGPYLLRLMSDNEVFFTERFVKD